MLTLEETKREEQKAKVYPIFAHYMIAYDKSNAHTFASLFILFDQIRLSA